MSPKTFVQSKLTTRLGSFYLVASERALTAVHTQDPGHPLAATGSRAADILEAARSQLLEYFAGARSHFDLPLEPVGTEFQKKVWSQLSQIPFGETRSYRDIALSLNSPKACRAVGGANGKNPLPILVPCHRVIAADGGLGGYSGGLDLKKQLLKHEGLRVI